MQVGTIMSSTPSSRRRTTSCLLCIESDAIVGNFNARQTSGGQYWRPDPSWPAAPLDWQWWIDDS
jgi:hypothetical protein